MNTGYKVFEENNTEYHSVSNYDVLIEEALAEKYIENNDLQKLKEWKKDPTDESWMTK